MKMALSPFDILMEAISAVESGEKEAIVSTRREPTKQQAGARSRRDSKRSYTYRTTHNQLEKNRRLQLKNLLEDLRGQVPSKGSVKLTTLNLLTTARSYIKELEMQNDKDIQVKEDLIRANACLKRRLSDLGGEWNSSSPKKVKLPSVCPKVTKLEVIDSESDVDVEDCSDDNSSIGSDGTAVNSN